MPCSHPVKGQCLSTSADVLEGELPQPQMHCSFRTLIGASMVARVDSFILAGERATEATQ